MFNGKPNSKKPTIRRETVLVATKKTPNPNGVTKPAANNSARTNGSRFKLTERALASTNKSPAMAKKLQAPAQRAIAASKGVKRKSNTPDRVDWSSESDDDSSEVGASDSDASRKRLKTSARSIESSGPRRKLGSESAFEESQPLNILHGADCTSGIYESKFKNPWELQDFETVQLQYPSSSERERFELKWPKNEKDDYKPMEDIIETVKQVVDFYLPEDLREKHIDDGSGFGRRFNRAWKRQSVAEFSAIVEEFNAILSPLVHDGIIKRELAAKSQLPFDLVRRVMDQIYSRTVSPKVESLRAYENGTDYVYGELLSRFCSTIFRQIKLNQGHVFVDLGSGVGNVVLQAALEVGCDSWGVEYMDNPCELAELQAKEFPGRCQLWGLKAGKVNLLRGDFTKNDEIAKVLKVADVVLVNNQAFTPDLNAKLRDMFLDLKDGCKVVSLKPFAPEGHKIMLRNLEDPANQYVQQKFEYFSGSVSWTDQSGYYFIATKDSRPLRNFMKEHGLP